MRKQNQVKANHSPACSEGGTHEKRLYLTSKSVMIDHIATIRVGLLFSINTTKKPHIGKPTDHSNPSNSSLDSQVYFKHNSKHNIAKQ